VALAMIEALDRQLAPLEQSLGRLARRQTGCRALMAHHGIGELTAPTMLCELGDVTRPSAAPKAVRCAGLDVGGHRSDRRSRAGKLTSQGSPRLRWALYESAQAACRPTSPDRADYLALKARGLSHTRASLTIARKLARRCFHTLRELGPGALEPVTRPSPRPVPPSPALPDDTQSSGPLPQLSRLPPPGGDPPKTERPESLPADRPIDHHLADPTVEHPDKPGRPRNDRSDRSHAAPQPLAAMT
jgi:Transposase IS116/IS110/IS902 family